MANIVTSFLKLTIDNTDILAQASMVSIQQSSASGVAYGIGNSTSGFLYGKKFSYVITFDTFELLNPADSFNLKKLSPEGNSQLIIANNRACLNGTNEVAFNGGSRIFSGISADVASFEGREGSPVMNSFTLLALKEVQVS